MFARFVSCLTDSPDLLLSIPRPMPNRMMPKVVSRGLPIQRVLIMIAVLLQAAAPIGETQKDGKICQWIQKRQQGGKQLEEVELQGSWCSG